MITIVTLKDIARQANLSVTTVSKVVNYNDTNVCSEQSRQLIWSLVESMGYRAKGKAVRQLPKLADVARKIAYVMKVPNFELSGTYLYKMIRGIEEETARTGTTIPFSCLSLELYDPEELAVKVEESDARAVIWIAGPDETYFAALARRGIAVILAGAETGEIPENIDFAGINPYGETMKWLRSDLLDRYETIGYIGEAGLPQYKAYLDAHKLADRSPDPKFAIFTEGGQADAAKTAVLRYCENEASLPDIWFAARDTLAIGALHAFQALGIEVPGRVGLIGFDNIELAEYVNPGLTTIGVPAFEIGRHAVATALTLLRRERDYPVHHLFATRLVKRGTL